MQKYFAFCLVVLSMAMIAMPIVGQDGKKSPKRLEVSELIVRDPETGNSVTIIASNSTAGIWVENKHLNRSVAMVSTGHTRDASQTFVSIYSGKNVGRGRGFNWAVSLDENDRPVQQVCGDSGTKIAEIKIK